MLNILGSEKRLCDGISRRDLLHIGGIGALGLGLDRATPLIAAPTDSMGGRARAKSCIFVFLFGSPPQHETFDPKPLAPTEIQGEMKAIDTAVPGLQIGEGLPQIARIADRLTVVRSMTHEYPIHCCAYVMSGMPTYSIPLETNPRAPEHWPISGRWLTISTDEERVSDPHAGIEALARFQLSQGCQLPQELSSQRFEARVHLLRQFDAQCLK